MGLVIVDTGVANVHSVRHAFAAVGVPADVTSDPSALRGASRLVLPGVGTFGACMDRLRSTGLDEALREEVRGGKPLLGICLGMQVLVDEGEELGLHRGLGLVPGRTRRLRAEEHGLRLPHIGWNDVRVTRPHFVLEGLEAGATFYFVHSFVVEAARASDVAATCAYGETFPCILAHDNVVATQFHPEKSQKHGFSVLERFTRWMP